MSIERLSHGIEADSVRDATRIRRCAVEFEGILLSTMLRSLQHSFATLGAKEDEMERDGYQDLSLQAMAGSLAQSGCLGIADAVTADLLRSAHSTYSVDGTKDFQHSADNNGVNSVEPAAKSIRPIAHVKAD